MSTFISRFVWKVCIILRFWRLKPSASVNSGVLCMLEYVIVTFSAIAYRVTRGSPELVSFSSHFSPSSSNCLWSFKMARFFCVLYATWKNSSPSKKVLKNMTTQCCLSTFYGCWSIFARNSLWFKFQAEKKTLHRLTELLKYTCFCFPWESNPQPLLC